MRQHLVVIACVAFMCGCNDEVASSAMPGPNAPSQAGACDYPAQSVCDEYADPIAAGTNPMAACTAAGGEWTGGKCPFAKRTGVCLDDGSATRRYTYTVAAATTLMSTCTNFVEGETPDAGASAGAGGMGAPLPEPDASAGAGGDGGLASPDGGLSQDGGL